MKRGIDMSAKDARQNRKGNKEKTNISVMILICIGILILISLVVIVVLLIKNKNAGEAGVTSAKRNVIITPENVDEITSQLEEQDFIPTGYYNTQMCMEWHFSNGYAISNDAFVKNDARNTNDVYFDVFLANDESTPILESPIIPIGSEMTQIALDTPLMAGEYDCVMIYHLVDDEQNTISTLRIGFNIVVAD